METYTQCDLIKPVEGKVIRTTSWIPTNLAKKGWVVRLKEIRSSDVAELWQVAEVYDTITEEKLFEMEKAARRGLPSIKAMY